MSNDTILQAYSNSIASITVVNFTVIDTKQFPIHHVQLCAILRNLVLAKNEQFEHLYIHTHICTYVPLCVGGSKGKAGIQI